MRYVSIDTETTGLDPDYCQVLEFAAVLDDLSSKPFARLPVFHCYVVHDRVEGQPAALAMNAGILDKIANRNRHPDDRFLRVGQVARQFLKWLTEQGFDSKDNRPVFATKNFMFDWSMLSNLPEWNIVPKRHRTLDPGGLFLDPETDQVPPGLGECMRRAGIGAGEVTHRAFDDALAVVRCLRFFYLGDWR